MVKEEYHETFRQRLFPTPDETNEIASEKYNAPYNSERGLGILCYRWGRSLVLASAMIWGAYQGIANRIEYSHGERTGMINKVSKKGLFWKTYEGQMALEGIVSGDNSVGANVWDFSIDRQARHGEDTSEIAARLQEYLRNGTKVRITYVEPVATWPWRSETDYLIQKVEPVVRAAEAQ